MHIMLLRHGQSYVNLDDWEKGYLDVGLTDLGHQQAQLAAHWIAEHLVVDALYTSTMVRTLETTAYLEQALGITAQRDDRLREFGNCYASGDPVPATSMPIEYAEFWGTQRPHTPIGEGAESWMIFRGRVSRFLDDVVGRHGAAGTNETVVVVCHGGVIEAAFDHVFNVGPFRQAEILTHNTGIVHFEYVSDSVREPWRLHAHGLAHHLTDENGEWHGSHTLIANARRRTAPTSPRTPDVE